MKRFAILLPLALSGCYTVPQDTDFTMTLNRNYKQVADCAWLTLREKSDWSKDDLNSMNRVEFSFGNTSSKAGRIDVIGEGPSKTVVRSHFPAAVWGKDFWPNKHRPIFRACGA